MSNNNNMENLPEEKKSRKKGLFIIGGTVAAAAVATGVALGVTLGKDDEDSSSISLNVSASQADVDGMFQLVAGGTPTAFQYTFTPSAKFKDLDIVWKNHKGLANETLTKQEVIQLTLKTRSPQQVITFNGVKHNPGDSVDVTYTAKPPVAPAPAAGTTTVTPVTITQTQIDAMFLTAVGTAGNGKDLVTFNPSTSITGVTFTSDLVTTKEYRLGETIIVTATPDATHSVTPSTYTYTVGTIKDTTAVTSAEIKSMFTQTVGTTPNNGKDAVSFTASTTKEGIVFTSNVDSTKEYGSTDTITVTATPQKGYSVSIDGASAQTTPATYTYTVSPTDKTAVVVEQSDIDGMFSTAVGTAGNGKDLVTFNPSTSITGVTFTSDLDTTKEYGLGETITVTATPDATHSVTPSTYTYTVKKVTDTATAPASSGGSGAPGGDISTGSGNAGPIPIIYNHYPNVKTLKANKK